MPLTVYLVQENDVPTIHTSTIKPVYQSILHTAQEDKHGRYRLTDSPDAADFILALVGGQNYGCCHSLLWQSAFFHRYHHKFYVYCPEDFPIPLFPGIYPAASRFWVKIGWIQGGNYLQGHHYQFEFVKRTLPRDLLFSFIGTSENNAIRAEILRLKHKRSLLKDTGSRFWYLQSSKVVEDRFHEYEDVLVRSRFALCPSGLAPSSLRLFEAMKAGCVPVIISDALILPEGPDWNSFSLRVSESKVSTIPTLLEELEPLSDTMGKLSRQAWEDFYSPQTSFNTVGNILAELDRGIRSRRRRLYALAYIVTFFQPNAVGSRARKIKSLLKNMFSLEQQDEKQ